MERAQGFVVTSDPENPGCEDSVRGRWALLPAIAYFLLSGITSLTIGAAISLAASGTGRLVLWSGVTGVIAILTGIAYESRLVRERLPALRSRGNQFGRP